MKKEVPLILYFLLYALPSFTQAPNWQWARSTSGPAFCGQEGTAVAADPAGNVFITGYFQGSYLGFGDTTLYNQGGCDIFVAKYSSAGNLLWARDAGGGHCDGGYAIATDANGNVFVTGIYNSDTITFGNTTFIGTSYQDVFILKYDSLGNLLWAKSAGGNGAAMPLSITTDPNNNVYVTGYYEGPVTVFDSDTLHVTSSLTDIFMAKYNAGGSLQWVKSYGGELGDIGLGIASDKGSHIYLVGGFASLSIVFGNDTLINKSALLGRQYNDFFVTQFDTSGNVIWAKAGIGNRNDVATGVATDAAGNAYISAWSTSDTIFMGNYVLPAVSSDTNHLIIAKYDSSGNVHWAKISHEEIVGYVTEAVNNIAADADGNVYVIGTISQNSMTFDSTTVLKPAVDSSSLNDPMFVVSFDSGGRVVCLGALASGADDCVSVCTDRAGNAFIGGDFEEVNPFIVGTDSLPLIGTKGEDIFVSKFICGKGDELGIENLTQAPNLLAHPNPFSNLALVQYALPAGAKNAAIIIYDMLGRQRSSYQLNNTSGEIIINSNNLSSGVYLYSLMADDRVLVTKKMVVEQ